MAKRKKWWALGLLHYGTAVRIHFFCTLFLIIFGGNILSQALHQLPEVDWKLYTSVIGLLFLFYNFSQFVRLAKKEYEEKKLGY